MTHNQINYWNLQETTRHNKETEGETKRHNVATEFETNRHNVVSEGIDLGRLNETIRHNQVSEGIEGEKINLGYAQLGETKRHNVASERVDLAKVNQGWSNLDESQRHNIATESIDFARQQSQEELNESQRLLNEVNRTWAGLQASSHVKLETKQKQKIQAEIDRIQQEITRFKFQAGTTTSAEIRNWVTFIAETIDSLIPG